MKEITRRLYTKPVMLGIALLLGTVLLAGLFVTTKSRAAQTFIPAGDDLFETTGNGESYHNFASSPLPAGFFNFDGAGTSNAYGELVVLQGKPLSTGSDIDTIIHRNQGIYPGQTTSLTMTGLSLVGVSPITVSYSDRASETWTIHVGLSAFKSSTGSMTIGAGGTFDSSLNVYPKFTFKRVSDGAEKVFDTGDPGGPGLMASQMTARDVEFEPAPEPAPTIAPAPCTAVINDFEGGADASASSSCAPVTLTSTNSPWQICANGRFCIPKPITEADRWAAHNASPPGTKKAVIQKAASTSSQ